MTLYTPISVCIFSLQFSINFLRCSHNQGAKQSRASFIGDNFHYSHDLYTWLNCDDIGRNSMLVTLRDQSAKKVIL